MSIAENIRVIREEMHSAAMRAGRRPEEISLIAAAKMNGADRVREAVAAGVDGIGENRVQELLEKAAKGAYEGAPVHFIGHLQKNKVKYVVGTADLIQSVDSEELLGLIESRAAFLKTVQDVLIQINIAGEETKSGVLPVGGQLELLLETASGHSHIKVRGLMAIPPVFTGNTKHFEDMYKLFVDTRAKKYDNISMEFLSMGMSEDFAAAIASGATMIRVGSRIFGQRV